MMFLSLSLPGKFLELKMNSQFGMGKRERSRNVAFAGDVLIISPSTPDSRSLNTDHAESTKGPVVCTGQDTHMQEKQGGMR